MSPYKRIFEAVLPDESLKLSLSSSIDELRPFLNDETPDKEWQKFGEFLQKELDGSIVNFIFNILDDDKEGVNSSDFSSGLSRALKSAEQRHGTEPEVAVELAVKLLRQYRKTRLPKVPNR